MSQKKKRVKADNKRKNEEQLKYLENGNISPCPYKEKCSANPTGCGGYSYWCRREVF